MAELVNIDAAYIYDLWVATPVASLAFSNFLLIIIVLGTLEAIDANFHGFLKRLFKEATMACAIVLIGRINMPIVSTWSYGGVFVTCCYAKEVIAKITSRNASGARLLPLNAPAARVPPPNAPGARVPPSNASGTAAAPIKECLGGPLTFVKLVTILAAQTAATVLALLFDAKVLAGGSTCDFEPKVHWFYMFTFEVVASCMTMTLDESPSRLKKEIGFVMNGLMGVCRVWLTGLGGINVSIYLRNVIVCPDANRTMATFGFIPIVTAVGSFFAVGPSNPEAVSRDVLPR